MLTRGAHGLFPLPQIPEPSIPPPGGSLLRSGCSTCLYHQRCFSGVAHLHRAYCEWELSHGAPCNRETFETLLREAGFLIVDTMVSGLILREDFDGVRVYPEANRVLR